MYWADEPATEQQLMHLRELGFKTEQSLMKTEAARLIRELRRRPARALVPQSAPTSPPAFADRLPELTRPPAESPAPFPATKRFLPFKKTPRTLPVNPPVVPAGLSESTKAMACRLRMAAEAARQKLASNPAGPNVRADAASTQACRLEFWLDTCREVKDMRVGSVQIMELYQNYGCRFSPPTQAQVQELLSALDSAMPDWDREHPEIFFQTLELNFAHLLRRP